MTTYPIFYYYRVKERMNWLLTRKLQNSPSFKTQAPRDENFFFFFCSFIFLLLQFPHPHYPSVSVATIWKQLLNRSVAVLLFPKVPRPNPRKWESSVCMSACPRVWRCTCAKSRVACVSATVTSCDLQRLELLVYLAWTMGKRYTDSLIGTGRVMKMCAQPHKLDAKSTSVPNWAEERHLRQAPGQGT